MTDGSRKGIGGPKTPEGRRTVSLNAIKNGLYAKSAQAMQILAEQVGRDYQDLYAEMRAYFKPKDPLEELLVRRVSRAAWRTLLTEAVENRELVRCGGMPGITSGYGGRDPQRALHRHPTPPRNLRLGAQTPTREKLGKQTQTPPNPRGNPLTPEREFV